MINHSIGWELTLDPPQPLSQTIKQLCTRASPVGQSLIQSRAAAPPQSHSFPAGGIKSPPCAAFLPLWMTDDCSEPFTLNKEGAQKRATDRGGRVDPDVLDVSCVQVVKYTTNEPLLLQKPGFTPPPWSPCSSYISSHFTADFDRFCVVKTVFGCAENYLFLLCVSVRGHLADFTVTQKQPRDTAHTWASFLSNVIIMRKAFVCAK